MRENHALGESAAVGWTGHWGGKKAFKSLDELMAIYNY
jgi:hypothetical protein